MTTPPQTIAGRVASPSNSRLWIAWVLVAFAFYLGTHSPMISVRMHDRLAGEGIERVSSGDSQRQAAFLLLGITGLIGLLTRTRYRLGKNGLLAGAIALYFFWAYLSLLWTAEIDMTFRRLIPVTAICLSAAAIARKFSLREASRGVLLATALMLVAGVGAEAVLGTFDPFDPSYRFAGTQHPNHQATTCALLFLSGIACGSYREKYWQFGSILAFVGFFSLVLTKSRTSFAATLCGAVCFWGFVSSASKRRIMVVGSILVLASGFLLMGDLMVRGGKSVVFLGRFVDEEAETLTGRLPLWEELLEISKERPLLGTGYGSFWTVARIDEISASQGWDITSSHSIFMDAIVNIGVIGLAFLVGIIGISLLSARRRFAATGREEFAFAFAVIIYGTIDGISETIVAEPTFLMYVFAVLIGKLIFDYG